MTAITVRRLITQLKKMPQNATIVVADHDHDYEYDGEFNGPVRGAVRAPPAIRARGYGVVIHL